MKIAFYETCSIPLFQPYDYFISVEAHNLKWQAKLVQDVAFYVL